MTDLEVLDEPGQESCEVLGSPDVAWHSFVQDVGWQDWARRRAVSS